MVIYFVGFVLIAGVLRLLWAAGQYIRSGDSLRSRRADWEAENEHWMRKLGGK